VLKPREGIHVPYFAHLFKSHPYIHALRTTSEFIRDGQDLTFSNFSLVPLPFVPMDEQVAIARYLDAMDAKVRRFIRNRRRLIEVLNGQKQGIINRAVTRGVAPSIQLKPSGIGWLGEIPEHWTIKPLKRWTKINKRSLPESTDPNFELQYIDIGAVGAGRLLEPPEQMRFGNAPSRARRILQPGDTIISTVRTYLRAVFFVDIDQPNLIASTGFAVLTPRPGIEPRFLSYAVQSNAFIERVVANSVGVAYPAITETRLGAFPIALPPSRDEQRSILRHVAVETESIDRAIGRAQREIALIGEYRTRLIADVVTGKVDARHLASTSRDADEPDALLAGLLEDVGIEEDTSEVDVEDDAEEVAYADD